MGKEVESGFQVVLLILISGRRNGPEETRCEIGTEVKESQLNHFNYVDLYLPVISTGSLPHQLIAPRPRLIDSSADAVDDG